MTSLSWLPEPEGFRARVRALAASQAVGDPAAHRDEIVSLARSRLNFVQTNGLVDVVSTLASRSPDLLAFPGRPVRLAVLGSCTLTQAHAAIRVAGWRRELSIEVHEADYGQYWQTLIDPSSSVHAFAPDLVLFALDAHHLAAGINAAMTAEEVAAEYDAVLERIEQCWRLAREAFGCPVVHQLPLPVFAPLLGSNEHRLAGSKAGFIARLSATLRERADQAGVHLLTFDERIARDGLTAWHDRGLWHRAKQEISPTAAPLYGDLVVRLIAASRGLSAKCLVLDLDNTLWGGVIGDDGLDGIVLGQGSALGEAFVAFQSYALELSRRGVILAVCSKNDEGNALEPFERHPDMVLKQGDIAAFVANWTDKASNLRAIAAQLNIGLDSLVFVDDNPFERTLVRQELPMVAVPEVGDDPSFFADIVAGAGYFEALSVTQDDRERGRQYQANRLRDAMKATATDLPSYLRSLDMQMLWRPFDDVGLARIVQLINKTNQFNLTTRRYSTEEAVVVMEDERAFGLQFRLVDRLGENGIVAIVIGRLEDDDNVAGDGAGGGASCRLDTWLMSCRVLGRGLEEAMLGVVAAEARARGARRLVGEFIATKKNAMVKDHYQKLGFHPSGSADDIERAVLDLTDVATPETFITIKAG